MLTIVCGVPLLTLLFSFLSHTNPVDPAWTDSLLRTVLIWTGTVVVAGVAFIEAKYFDKKFVIWFCKFCERGGIEDD